MTVVDYNRIVFRDFGISTLFVDEPLQLRCHQKDKNWQSEISTSGPPYINDLTLLPLAIVSYISLPSGLNLSAPNHEHTLCSTQAKCAGATPHCWLSWPRLCSNLRFSKVPSRCGPCIYKRLDPTAKAFLSLMQPLCHIPTFGLQHPLFKRHLFRFSYYIICRRCVSKSIVWGIYEDHKRRKYIGRKLKGFVPWRGSRNGSVS